MTRDRRTVITAGAFGLAAALRPGAALADPAIIAGGKADQTGAVMAAAVAAQRSGKALVLPGGVIRVASLALPDGVVLLGAPGRTRLVAARPGEPLLLLKAQSVAHLEGLAFDGGGQALDAKAGLVMADGVAGLTVRNCSFRASPGLGLTLRGCGGRITDNDFEALDTALYANDSTGLAITGNRVRNCANNGILVHRSVKGPDGSQITGNHISQIGAEGGGLGWFGNGVNVYRAGQVLVAHNTLSDCAFTFIRANAADGVQIIGNSGRNAGETGIYCEFGFEGAVIAQNLIEHVADGVSVVNFDKGGRLATVTGNVVRNAARRTPLEAGGHIYGNGVNVEADTALTGNVVENCATAGFMLGYGNFLRDVAMTGNVARQCGEGARVTVAEAAGNVLISANLFSGCAGGVVVGYEWAKRATGDLTQAGALMPPGVLVAGNLTK